MNKETLKKLLKGDPITQKEVFEFITDCVEEHGKKVNGEQLQGILIAIQQGIFDIRHKAEQIGIKLGWLITKTMDKHGRIINVDIKE